MSRARLTGSTLGGFRMRMCLRFRVLLVAYIGAGLLGAPPACAAFEPRAQGITNVDIRLQLQEADEATIVLLNDLGITNDRAWREHFSGQVFGFGIRTAPMSVTPQDLARIKDILLDASSYEMQDKDCSMQGDAALMMRSPIGEVLVMFELGCGRVHIVVQTDGCLSFYGQVDPKTRDLILLARKYFENDEHLRRLGERWQ
jgi:hypothetical protein